HELQERVAQLLGYAGAQPQQQVERLMSDYFRHARVVSRSLDWVRRSAPTPLGVNLVQSRDGIRFVDARQATREPQTWLSLFQSAVDAGAPVADDTLGLIQLHAPAYDPEDFFPAQAGRAVLNFLKPRPGLYARLS